MSGSIAVNKKTRGRPKTGIGPVVGVRLYPEMEKQVNDWIAGQGDRPSRPEALRRLVQLGLDAWAGGQPAKPTRASKPVKATKIAPPKKTRQRRP